MFQISPLAFVHPNAKIGDNVTINAFAYIDDNVEIGEGCVIGARKHPLWCKNR